MKPRDDLPERKEACEWHRRRVFLVQTLLTPLLLLLYLFSGVSSRLARGLEDSFGGAWWWVNAAYLVITVLGYAVALFPFSYYSGLVLERHFGLAQARRRRWGIRYALGLLLDVALVGLFFSAVYALLRKTPNTWWIGAALSFVVLVVLFGLTAPSLIAAFFPSIRPLTDRPLQQALLDFVQRLDRRVTDVCVWHQPAQRNVDPVVLSGWGRRRRLVLAPGAAGSFTRDGLTALAAREVGHLRMRTGWRLFSVGALLGLGGFYLIHQILSVAIQRVPEAHLRSIADIAGFPAFVFSLLLFAVLVMPLLHAHTRHLEYAADGYAVRTLGRAEPLIEALQRQPELPASHIHPGAWVEWLFRRRPTLAQRERYARRVERSLAGRNGTSTG